MIKSFYIMKQNGLLIYSKNYTKEDFEDNIMIGFFASIANFSREALRSVIKHIDLGQDNKLVLAEQQDEKLVAAAIVNSSDDNDLITKVLKNIMHEIIIMFSPDYESDKIDINEMEKIIDGNIKNKTSLSTIKRLVLSWIILVPITILIAILNLMATSYYFQYIFFEERTYSQEELITEVIPEVMVISMVIVVIVFVVPNLISGYITLNRNLAFLNSGLYLVVILIAYLYSVDPLFFFVILFYLPAAVFTSNVFAYIGFRLGIKKKIVKK
ncbi:MAG: hypothetical protein ACFFDN_15235 [Candidatus Hodarchaeota archaeon]